MARKHKLAGTTYKVKTGCGTMYITINEDDNVPFEVFATMGKAGGCAASQIETIGRLISLGLRNKVKIEDVIRQMQGICCHSAITAESQSILSCADAIAKTLKKYMEENSKNENEGGL